MVLGPKNKKHCNSLQMRHTTKSDIKIKLTEIEKNDFNKKFIETLVVFFKIVLFSNCQMKISF